MALSPFKELHPDLKVKGGALRGARIKGSLGGAMTIVGAAGDMGGFFNGNPDSWIASFPCIGCGFEDFIGRVQKEPNSELYFTITKVHSIYDKNTGKLQYKEVSYDIYSDFIWDDDVKKYRGINRVDPATETFKYDGNGNKIEPSKTQKQYPIPGA